MTESIAAPTLWDATRHEGLQSFAWFEHRARETIERIVGDAEASWSAHRFWPVHPKDREPGDDPQALATAMYHGAAGVIWALHYLRDVGAASLTGRYGTALPDLLRRHRGWLSCRPHASVRDPASYLMGDLPILMLMYGEAPARDTADAIAALVEGNIDHPARELMWGSPGTLLAASLMFERTKEERWVALYRLTAERLWDQLEWSDAHDCAFWSQDLYGLHTNYIDAVHGFVGTAFALIRGHHLLDGQRWSQWAQCIANTVRQTASLDGPLANWRPWLVARSGVATRMLMQYCHGAPGFVISLADFPDASLDDLLLAGGEAIWAAGPLKKGSNLCHGTGGNGYALLKLFGRTQDQVWLDRARAFAMHGIAQTAAGQAQYGHMRHSLWTGDPGFAIFLWDCLRGRAAFPLLDIFHGQGT
jgi:hypothetical protein